MQMRARRAQLNRQVARVSETIELHGSFYVSDAHGPILWNELSTDGRYLGAVTLGIYGTFLAHVFRRIEDHQTIGTWWSDVDNPSTTDSLGAAKGIVHSRIANLIQLTPPGKSLKRARER